MCPIVEPVPPVIDDVLVPLAEQDDEEPDAPKRRKARREDIPWIDGLDGVQVRYDGEWREIRRPGDWRQTGKPNATCAKFHA